MSAAPTAEIEALLRHEADLLDGRRYRDWLALYAERAEYWVPVLEDQASPHDELSIIYDTRPMMVARVHRLDHARVHSQQPVSRSCRIVTLLDLTAADDGFVVRSKLVMVEYRADRQTLYAADVEHLLRRHGDRLLIARKRVDLINSGGMLEMISIPF